MRKTVAWKLQSSNPNFTNLTFLSLKSRYRRNLQNNFVCIYLYDIEDGDQNQHCMTRKSIAG